MSHDGSSVLLDRFGLLLLLVLSTVVGQALIDVGGSFLGASVTHAISGAALRAFWGMLFALLFFIPLLGAAIGAGIGALAGSMADVGIDDKFIDGVKQRVTPGASALFLLTSEVVEDRVNAELSGAKAELIASNLSAGQEAKLREVFGEE